jgi:hypothetical protein
LDPDHSFLRIFRLTKIQNKMPFFIVRARRFSLPSEVPSSGSGSGITTTAVAAAAVERQRREQRLSYMRYRTQISRENQPEEEEESEIPPPQAASAVAAARISWSPSSSPPLSAFSPVTLLSSSNSGVPSAAASGGGGGENAGGGSSSQPSYPRYVPRPSVLARGKPDFFFAQHQVSTTISTNMIVPVPVHRQLKEGRTN